MSNTHKIHIKSAVAQGGNGCRLSLRPQVLSTCKIAQIMPVFSMPVIPGDKLNVNINHFARFEPLVVPSYVRLNYRTMSVFVPYHQIMDGADSWFSNQKLFKGVTNTLPTISASVLRSFLINVSTEQNSASGADFFDGAKYHVFTAKGRYYAKVLNLLGVQWTTKNTSSDWINVVCPPTINALPILAFAHAYNSYMSYSAHYNTSALSNLLETIKRSPRALTLADLRTIFTSICLTYEESFASNAWESPYTSTSDSDYTNFITSELGVPGSTDRILGDGEDGSVTQTELISAAQMRLLQRFDLYFRRTNFAGSKDIEQIYSRFGVRVDDYKTRYPYFLGESSEEVQIGDVTSTSDTEAAPIGAYAGKAISNGGANFSFDSKDYGMLFCFAWYAPLPIYYTGVDKEFLRLAPLDFYTPELDEGFASPISMAQVNAVLGNNVFTNTFGYTQLYSEYLQYTDKIVGDYRRFEGYDAWHFGRSAANLSGQTAQTDTLIYMSNGGTEYERIFNVSDTNIIDADSIYCTDSISISGSRPMKDFTGKTQLGDGQIDLPNMGSQMN